MFLNNEKKLNNFSKITLMYLGAILFTMILFLTFGAPIALCHLIGFNQWIGIFSANYIIFIAYMIIPYNIYKYLYSNTNVFNNNDEIKKGLVWVKAFIISCGTHHLFYTINAYWNAYWVWTIVTNILAIISIIAALKTGQLFLFVLQLIYDSREKDDLEIRIEGLVESLNEAESNFAELFDNIQHRQFSHIAAIKFSPIEVWVVDKHYNYLIWSDSYIKRNKFKKQNVINGNLLIHRKQYFDDNPHLKDAYQDVLSTGTVYQQVLDTKPESRNWWFIQPFTDEQDRIIGIITYTSPIKIPKIDG